MTSFHISLTGHRPHKLAGYDLTVQFYRLLQSTLEEAIAGALKVHPHLTLHSGLALGADTVWSKAILAQRALHPDRITFVAEVPTMGQASVWRGSGDREFWQHQIDVADQVNVYADRYTPRAMQLRNEGMIRPANLLLAIWDGSAGGTGHAVRFAGEIGVDVHTWHPGVFRRPAQLVGDM